MYIDKKLKYIRSVLTFLPHRAIVVIATDRKLNDSLLFVEALHFSMS